MSGKFWSPLILSAEVPAASDTSVNPQKILNPNRGPMLVDQFRFHLSPSPIMPSIGVELRLGSIPMMGKPVSLGALAARYLNFGSYGTFYVWHLPEPLFVPANVQLFARFTAFGLYASGTPLSPNPALPVFATFQFSVAGRSLPEGEPNPAQIAVPWVSEARCQSYSTSWRSPDTDLINPHKVPLQVRQFVSARVPATGSFDPLQPLVGVYPPYLEDMTVQMTASNGIAIIASPTPYNLLFPDDTGLLEVNAALQPGQFISVELDHPEAQPESPAWAVSQCQFTTIGMVGYRMVETPPANTK